MHRTFRYPLHPTSDQAAGLATWLRFCQQLYNAALESRKSAWEHEKLRRQLAVDRGDERPHGKMPSYNSQSAELTALRACDTDASSVPVRVARSALRRCDRAFQAFFKRCRKGATPGYPRFRARDRYESFSIGRVAPHGDERRDTRSAHVRLPRLGLVRFHEYRPLRGMVLDTSVRYTAGKWYICFSCDLGAAPAKVPVRNAVGIDMGLTSFATLSDGSEIANPRHGRRGHEQLARRQRALARKKRGTVGRQRAKLLVVKAYEHVKNQRLDHARKLAAVLVAKYDLIAHEDLNIRGMVHGNLARSIHDAAWGTFIHALTCKAEEAGKWCVPVDPRGTSQRCSSCGQTVTKTLAERRHVCSCGCVLGRDENAAKNVLALGRSAVLVAEGK